MWSLSDGVTLKDKIIVITGATSGIGFSTAKECACLGATVIIASRNPEKGSKAKNQIYNICSTADIHYMHLDLASFESIETFNKQFRKKYKRIDILVNNAGLIHQTYESTTDGFEMQMQINHLGPFLLTKKLFDLVKKGNEPMIINTSSVAHTYGKLNFDSFVYNPSNKYIAFRQYSQTKLANMMFSLLLAEKVSYGKLPIKVITTHPGIAKTQFTERGGKSFFKSLMNKFTGVVSQTSDEGALGNMRAITDPSIKNGDYVGPNSMFGAIGNPIVLTPAKHALNRNKQNELWSVTEKYTENFEI
jgi:NAD(P)-dependent dehydrogenase (short-subunit alcohol dehydrogenase family)